MGIREEFYASLRDEYTQEGENSFLYQYFRNRPRQRRGPSRDAAPQGADVHRDIRTFLYDVEHGRKKDQSLAMLDDYCARRGISSLLRGGESERTPEELAELDAFCRSLQAGDNDTVLLPLKIDPGTGAGLYLMGSYFLEDAGLPPEGACSYVCLWLEDLSLSRAPWDDQFLWSIATKDGERLREQCGFPNLAEALCWFDRLTAMNQQAYQAYTLNNGPAPPHCPPALLRYFEPARPFPARDEPADRDNAALIAQGRESYCRDGSTGEP